MADTDDPESTGAHKMPGEPNPGACENSETGEPVPEQSSFDDFNEKTILGRMSDVQNAAQEPLTPDERSVHVRPGTVINKRFKVLKQIGLGGMGAVYLVRDMHLQEHRALKVMLPRLLANPQAQRRFLIEAKVSQKLSHENIVRVHDLGVDFETGMQFFTMALVEGETLLRHLHQQGGTLAPGETLMLLRQLCRGLSYAHRSTIHRDLKPQNIMRGADGHVTVLDFGLAKLLDQNNPSLSRMGVGTIHYQAPEQKTDPLNIDRRADLYAVGVIMYQLLTGKLPVGKYPAASRLVTGVPRRADHVIRRCLQLQDQRYATADELLADLDGVERGGFYHWLGARLGR